MIKYTRDKNTYIICLLYIYMDWWTTIILFFIVLFLYIHIQYQYKRGDDLEIYEYEYTSPKALQDICQYKQPVLFYLQLPSTSELSPLEHLNVIDNREFNNNSITDVDHITLSNRSARGIIDTDTKSVFYSCRNDQHLNADWNEWFSSLDSFLKPPFCIYRHYDVIYGSRKTQTTSLYHLESHSFLCNTKSTVRVKMCPWKYESIIKPIYDYINYEWWSDINLFTDKRIKTLEFIIKPGGVLYLPPYWFYSLEFQDTNCELALLKYTTGANALAHVNHIALHKLQEQNLSKIWIKPLQNLEYDVPISPDDDKISQDISQNVILDTSGNNDPSLDLIDELKPKC